MMARNEETLIRRHLSSWMPLLNPGGCIVGQVDDRSTDGSHSAFLDETIIPLSAVPFDRRHVYHYTFDGLGPARSLLLSEADAKFGHVATHYFIADPDWRFDISPQQSVKTVRSDIARSMKGNDELIQAFKIFDRNGASSRWLDWFFRARQGLKFKYRWHEMLDIAAEDYTYVILESFTVTETEGGMESYHNAESGGSGTVARFLREIALLEKDIIDYPEDTRVLYYLGVDHSSVLVLLKQAAMNKGGRDAWRGSLEDANDYREHWTAAVEHFRKRVWSLWGDAGAHTEMAWASALWLGRCLHDLNPTEGALNDEALRAYDRCIEVDPERVECRLQKVRLLVEMNQVEQAWGIFKEAEGLSMPERTFLHVPYHYSCTVLAMGAYAAIANQLGDEGRRLLSLADLGCPHGVYDESPTFLDDLEVQLELVQRGGKSNLGGTKSKVLTIPTTKTFTVGVPLGQTRKPQKEEPSKPRAPASNPSVSRSASSSISGAVKGIRAVRASSSSSASISTQSSASSQGRSSESQTASQNMKKQANSPSATTWSLQSDKTQNDFSQVADRWLDLALQTLNVEERANLIAKALLAQPSEATLDRLQEFITSDHSCIRPDKRREVNSYSSYSRQALLDELQEKEFQVSALLQQLARTD